MNKEEIKKQAQESLLFYLDFYYELIGSRPKHYKGVVDREIKDLIKQLKELGRYKDPQ